jgi:hypothetical protein
VRLASWSFLKMLLTWLRTVASPTTSVSAISWLLIPRASRRKTSSSRSDSGSVVRGCVGRAGRFSSCNTMRAIVGCSTVSPR